MFIHIETVRLSHDFQMRCSLSGCNLLTT